jgi:hypothetical protein
MQEQIHQEPEIHLHPDPEDPDYFDKVIKNAIDDRKEGESNPNYNNSDTIH